MMDSLRLIAFLAGMVMGHACTLWHMFHDNYPAATFFFLLACYMDWSFQRTYREMTDKGTSEE